MKMNEILHKESTEQKSNYLSMDFRAISENESLARVVVTGFVSELDPTLEELSDIKTAVSEAVTNAIIHGYAGKFVDPLVHLVCHLQGDVFQVIVLDYGVGMTDVAKAMQPLYTSKPELERSGMGFSFMEAFMDDLQVESTPGKGTKVTMTKKIGTSHWIDCEE